jgi:hypothetical protein
MMANFLGRFNMAEQRTLVCVFAQTREHELVWKNFKKNVLDALNADLALCIAVPDDYAYANPYWQHAKYKWTCPEYENWMDAFEYAKKISFPQVGDDWKTALTVPGNWISPLNGNPAGGALQIFFRWLLWQHLQKDDIFAQYDRVVFTRSDFMFLSPHPPMDLLSQEHIWLPNGEYYGGVTDRHAVLSRKNAEGYLMGIMKNIMTNTSQFCACLREAGKNYDRHYATDTDDPNKVIPVGLEMSIKVNLDFEFPVDTCRFFPYIMYTVRSADGKSRHNYGTWYEELGYFIKSPEELFSAKTYQAIYVKPQDWYTVPRVEAPPYWNSTWP